MWIRPIGYAEDELVMQPLTVGRNQKCFICRQTGLVPKENTYEIHVVVSRKNTYRASGDWEEKRVLVCDSCLESIPELADAEVLGFGDGKRLPVENFMEG